MKRQWFERITCILVWFLLVSAFTTSLRTDLPANDDDPTEAPAVMRAIKSAYQERLDVDHYFTSSATSTFDAADTGKHRYVTFQGPNTIASVAANEGSLAIKDVNSIAELHWRDESENEKQLTSLGLINIEETDIAAILLDDDTMAADSATSIASQQSIKAYVDAADSVIRQVVNATVATAGTGSTLIPYDDTIPQNDEGDQYLTATITPTDNANILDIEIQFHWSTDSASQRLLFGLFQDDTASAIAGGMSSMSLQYFTNCLRWNHRIDGGIGTSATTFKFRAGQEGAFNMTMNGVSGSRKLGGVMESSITITEIKQ